MSNNYFRVARGLSLAAQSADGTNSAPGDIAYNSTTLSLRAFLASAWYSVATTQNNLSIFASTTSTQFRSVISDPTGTGSVVFGTAPTLAAPVLSSTAIFTEIATPSTPSAGTLAVYSKIDDKLYTLNSAGTETQVGSGASSSSVNYISNGSFEETANGVTPTGWVAYADVAATTPVDGSGGSPSANVTFLASTTSPLRGTTSAIFTKDAINRQGTGYSYAFTIASPDKSTKCQTTFELDCSANYVAGDIGLYLYDVTNSVLITPSTASLPKVTTGKFQVTFDTTTSVSYRLILHIASTSALAYTVKFDSFVLNSGVVVQGAAVSEATSFVPTGTWTANTTYTGQYWRVGSRARIYVSVAIAGTPTTANLFLNMPSGMTINSSLVNISTSSSIFGQGQGTNNTGFTPITMQVIASGSNSTVQIVYQSSTSAQTSSVNATTPSAWTAGNTLSFIFEVPIAEWSGSGTVNLGAGAQVEYASNSNATNTATDTTSFVNGPAGSNIPNGVVGTAYNRLVQFSNPIQVTDQIKLEVSTDGLKWLDIDERFGPRIAQGTNNYGVQVTVSSATQVNVEFGIGGVQPNNATYAGNSSTSWSAFTGFKWRVSKATPSAPVGFGLASTTVSGLVQFKVPTIQKFLSGSGTYTTPSSCIYIKVKMVGAGGGGGGSTATTGAVAGGAGGNTTFGTALLVANGGNGGGAGNSGGGGGSGGTGGTASLGTGPIGNAVSGGQGQSGYNASATPGPIGASSPFGGAGSSAGGAGGSGTSAATNSGSGGGGGGGTAGQGAGGGGSGGYIDCVITSLLTTYAYAIGAAGTAGTGTSAGGAGGSGIIIVEEYYQ